MASKKRINNIYLRWVYWYNTIMKKYCKDCGKPKSRKGVYCKSCSYNHRTRPSGLKYKKHKDNPTSFRKGDVPWNKNTKGLLKPNVTSFKKGYHYSPDTEFSPDTTSGENNSKWKGDGVGYYGLHSWIVRNNGKAKTCSNRDKGILNFKCGGVSHSYDWALKKGCKYERNMDNFIQLCHSCHKIYDSKKKTK